MYEVPLKKLVIYKYVEQAKTFFRYKENNFKCKKINPYIFYLQ